MNPTPDPQMPTLAQALKALRDDLSLQPMPPPSVLAAAQRAARQARDGTPAAGSFVADVADTASTTDVTDAAEAGRPGRSWRLPGWPRSTPRGAAGARAAWGPWAGAATCACVLGLSLLLALRPPPSEHPVRPDAASQTAAAGSAGPAARPEYLPAMHFVPLVSAERMRALAAASGPSGADTPAWVVTTELPQERLAAMGLPYDPGHAAERLRAELLVAGSGEVLAVRLLF